MSVKTFSINNTDVANAHVILKVDSLIWQIYSNFFQCDGHIKNAVFNTVFYLPTIAPQFSPLGKDAN